MLIINPTISNKTLLPVLITHTLPLQREIPTNKNFVSKAIAIVQSAQSGDFEQLDAQLIRLEESSTYEEVRQHLPELIRQVQATQASKDLPTLYERLVKRLKIDDPLLVEDFSSYPEEFRIACAKHMAKEPKQLCSNIKKFAIKNQDALIALAQMCAQEDSRCEPLGNRKDRSEQGIISIYIDDFGIESEEARIAIAKIAAKYDAEFSKYIQNYKITNKSALRELAEIALENADETFHQNLEKYLIDIEEILPRLVDWVPESEIYTESFCENVFNLNIQDCQLRSSIVDRLLKNPENLTFVCANINRFFSIEEQSECIKYAKFVAEEDGNYLFHVINEFHIIDKEAIFEIVSIVLEKFGSSVKLEPLKFFKLSLEKREILYSKFAHDYPARAEPYPFFAEELENQAELVRHAKYAAEQDQIVLPYFDENFPIKDQETLFEIACVALDRFGASINLDRLKHCGLNCQNREILYERFTQKYPERSGEFYHFFSEEEAAQLLPEILLLKDEETIQLFPEMSLSNRQKECNISKYLFNLWEIDKESYPLSLIQPLHEQYQKLAKKEDSDLKAEKTRMLILRCSVLTFAKGSPILLKELTSILDEIEKKDPLVKNQIITWMAGFISNCRFKKITESFLRENHLSLFKELINLPDPQLREMLTPYFVDELLHSRLENMVEKRKTVQKSKKLGEEINKKDLAKYFTCMLTASLCSEIEPYLEVDSQLSKNKSHIIERWQRMPFAHRMQELTTNKYFKDSLNMKSLLKSLSKLMTTDKLTNAQKGVVLRDLIFVKNEKLSIKQQSEQVLRSSQNIALFIEYNPLQLTEMASPKELETALQKEFSKAFHVEVDNFTEKFSKTFGSMRNPAAILTYASGLKSLPPSEEHAKLQPLLEECVEWILNQTFSTHCYSLQKNPSEHLEKLLEHTEIMENWKKEVIYDYDEYQVIFRRNAEDLILIGKGTCQTVDGDPLVNKCLGAYILDPKNSPAIIKKKGGTEIVARSMIRLLFDENENPVLFKEYLYTDAYSKGDFEKIITESCVKRAKQLKKEGGIPLLQKDKSCTKNVVTLKAYAGRWPYEMVDANGSIQGNKGFKIKSCAYLYKPEPKPS